MAGSKICFSLLLGLVMFLQLLHTNCEERDLSVNEIQQEVAEALRKDYLRMLFGNFAQKKIRTQRRGRSGNRKHSSFYPVLLNLIRRTYSNRANHVEASRDWGREVKSAIRKYWNTYYDPNFYRRTFPVVNINTPTAIRNSMLVNRLQKTLVVKSNKVRGTNNVATPSSKLQFQSVGFGALMIKGIKANKYICMDRTSGKVYPSSKRTLDCVFMEKHQRNHYQTYHAFMHRSDPLNWFLAINSKGEIINGKKSKSYRKTSQFMRIRMAG